MPNVRLLIEYNGSYFHGFQRQPGEITIQGELERVISMIIREEVPYVQAAGRTDAGVHARGQVVNFHCNVSPDLNRLKHSISSIFKGKISVLSADIADDRFDSRKNAISKQYVYTILNRVCPAVLDAGKVWHVSAPLDIERMKLEAAKLIGIHDFTSFRGARCYAKSPVKEILESEIILASPYVIYRVIGRGFLKQMVRIIVGTLVDIGRGFILCDSILEILKKKDRRAAGVTAQPQGLCLEWVKYPDDR